MIRSEIQRNNLATWLIRRTIVVHLINHPHTCRGQVPMRNDVEEDDECCPVAPESAWGKVIRWDKEDYLERGNGERRRRKLPEIPICKKSKCSHRWPCVEGAFD